MAQRNKVWFIVRKDFNKPSRRPTLGLGLVGFLFQNIRAMAKKQAKIIQATIDFWKAYTGRTLSTQEAREAVANMSGFFELLSEWEGREREKEVNKPAGVEEGE